MDADALFAQAQAALKGGFPQTAAELLARLLRSDPRHERAWLLLASIVTDKDQVIECLHRVLEVNPENDEARKLMEQANEKAAREEMLRGQKGNLPRLGKYLLDSGVISGAQLEAALVEQRKAAKTGKAKRLGDMLILQRAVTARQVQEAVQAQLADFNSLFQD